MGRQLAAQAQAVYASGLARQELALLLAVKSMQTYQVIDATELIQNSTLAHVVAHMEHKDVVNCVAFSPDGLYVVSGSLDGAASVWEVSTGGEIASMPHEGQVISVTFSPDGKYILSTSGDKTARVWEAHTGKEIARMTHEGLVNSAVNGQVNSAAFSPDGKYVVSGGGEQGLMFGRLLRAPKLLR